MKILANSSGKPLFNTETGKLLRRPDYAAMWYFDYSGAFKWYRDGGRNLKSCALEWLGTKCAVVGELDGEGVSAEYLTPHGRQVDVYGGLYEGREVRYYGNNAITIQYDSVGYNSYLRCHAIGASSWSLSWSQTITGSLRFGGIDGSGNIVVTNGATIYSYTQAGIQSWSWNTQGTPQIAVSSGGDVITGMVYTNLGYHRWRIYSLDSAGNQNWYYQGSPSTTYYSLYNFAADSVGNLYFGSSSLYTWKIDNTGSVAWYTGAASSYGPYTFGPLDEVYAVATTYSGVSWYYGCIEINPSTGARVWWDRGLNSALDEIYYNSALDLIVVARSANNYGYFIHCCNTSGVTQWGWLIRNGHTSGGGFSKGISFDIAGSMLVVGTRTPYYDGQVYGMLGVW